MNADTCIGYFKAVHVVVADFKVEERERRNREFQIEITEDDLWLSDEQIE